MRLRFGLIFLCGLSSLLAGTVEGIVRDPSGAAIPHCSVTLKGTAATSVDTDARGSFRFSDVPGGKVEITVQCPGFETNQKQVDVAEPAITVAFEMKIATQETAVEVAGKRSSLANSDPNYRGLRDAKPTHSYQVKNLVLRRDAGTFTFTSGMFSFIAPVLGQVPAAVFTGEGSFHLQPATPLEKSYLQLISGFDAVDEDFRSAIFWFSDSTYDEIKKQAQAVDAAANAGHAWQEFHSRTRHRTENPRSMVEYLLENEYVANQEAEILGELYNPKQPGSFRAFIHGTKHEDLRFTVNPRGAMPYMPSPEEVALVNLDPAGTRDGIWYLSHLVSEVKDGSANSLENRHEVQAARYRIETVIGRNDHLASTCSLSLRALTPGTRIVGFGLLPSLRVTRVTYKEKEIQFVQEGRSYNRVVETLAWPSHSWTLAISASCESAFVAAVARSA